MDWRCLLFYLIYIVCFTKTTSMSSSPDMTHMKYMTPTNPHIAFGGVLNTWIHRVPLNDTDVRRAAKFAVKYAQRRQPDAFPLKSEVKYTHKVKNINKLKLVYTQDNMNPAMFNMYDSEIHQPVHVPVIWGLLYTFQILVQDLNKIYNITHTFTILEYVNEKFYVLEHAFYCTDSSNIPPQIPFGSSCGLLSSGYHEEYRTYSEHKPYIQSDYNNNIQVNYSKLTQSKTEKQDSVITNHERASSIQTSQSDSISNLDQSYCTAAHDCDTIKQAGRIYQKQAELTDTNSHVMKSKPEILGSPKKTHFSILTYNIWNTNINGEAKNEEFLYIQRIKHLAKQCQDIHADIITFQEVRFDEGKGGVLGANQLHHLATLLADYQYVFQPGQIQLHGVPDMIIEGVAIFSRHPIVNRNHILLHQNHADGADGHQRVLLHAEINVPFVGHLHVLTTHLSLSHEARLTTVQQIWDYIQTLEGPVFLTGDFNAEAHNEEVRFLGGKYAIHDTKTSGFYDIWELHHGNHNKGFTFNSQDSELTKRIDLIFMKEQDGLALVDVNLVDDSSRGASAPSDHLGLLGKFAMQTH